MASNRKKVRRSLKIFFITVSIIISVIIIIGLILVLYYVNSLPTLEELTPSPIAETSKVYALDGSLITEFHAEENREIISFNKMSDYIKDAIVAIEDKRFFEHQGVDYRRIIGAFISDIRSGEWAEGASTITQQYVKNIYFSQEKTFRRKINEALIAIQLERNYTKNKILEMYLNTINFGSGAYGIEKASEIYFGKDASELNLPESALLAGLLRAPEIYSPFNNMEKAKSRRDLVLQLMYEQKLIDTSEYLGALAEPIILNESSIVNTDRDNDGRVAPYFIDYVKRNLYDQKFTDYDVFKGGLRIYTTLDIDLQNKAENAFKKVFPEEIEPSYCLVSTDPENGYIYAFIGGKDYDTSKFNIAIQGKRQPGSVFKVLVLMEAIKQNISPNNTFNPNGPIIIDMKEGPDWEVHNYGDQKFDTDQMSIVDGTVNSVNVIYAQLMMEVGAENVENLCSEMEIYGIGNNPAIALGGLETGVTPLDVSKVFSTLASGGFYRQPVSILKITDSEGNILYEYEQEENESNHRVLEEPIAYYITQILRKVVESGTGRGAAIGRPAAGKTGTTSDLRDAWFAGYTPDLVTVVWMGNLDNTPMEAINGRTIVGGSYPADVWREFMASALEDVPESDFVKPDKELVDIKVCTESGLLATFWCPEESIRWNIYIKGEEPEDICNIHNKIEIPDVIGSNIEEARTLLESLNFEVEEIYDFDEIFNQNSVFNQNPEAGTILESPEGEKLNITLYVSKGPATFSMPGLIGMDLKGAEQLVKSFGLVVNSVIYEFSDTVLPGYITNQIPARDSIITKSAVVVLYVSKGENPQSVVPDLIGKTSAEAIDALINVGFENVTITLEESEEEKDLVFLQNPASGTIYDKLLEVTIKVSLGIKVPDVTGMTKGDAILELEGLGFIVEILPDTASLGNVVNQMPAAEEYLNYGSTVTITIV
ncbi:MAG: PBP1A family penicillin-binding protein [Actinomycetota bacterium]|nr:PBP1A family penicillin-binding protein [Actinomycetota bacterium]